MTSDASAIRPAANADPANSTLHQLRDISGCLARALTAGEQERRDALAAARLIATLAREPALRPTWLMACAQAEAQIKPIVAGRAGRPVDDFEVRLCAATIIAGTRVVDETISSSALNEGRVYTSEDVTNQLAAAIRAASILPICDPVA